MRKIKTYHSFVNEFVSDYMFRVYKKNINHYRIEEKVGNKWVEIETDKDIENVLLQDCHLVVNEEGRKQTINKSFESSEDVPVHAWIECNKYEIGGQLHESDGILYYNPFKVKFFCDRESFESGDPLVIHKCSSIGIKGNYLEYDDATVSIRDKSIIVEDEVKVESVKYNLVYSPIF